MKFNIPVTRIMKREFPIADLNESLTSCARIMGKSNFCLILKEGNIIGVANPQDLILGFLNSRIKLSEINFSQNIGVISSESDISELAQFIKKKNLEYVLIRSNNNIVGIITKKDFSKLQPFLLKRIEDTIKVLS